MKCFSEFEKDVFRCAVDKCCRGGVRLTDQGPLCAHHYLYASRCKIKGCSDLGPYDGLCREHYMVKIHPDYNPVVATVEEIASRREPNGLALIG